MSDFTDLPDLASERIGGRVLLANDEFFAPKENLLRAETPIFDPDRYTERGKWMDGWETRRRRDAGYDWCVVRLGAPGAIRGVIVDTSHFTGNHPQSCSLEACALEGEPDIRTLSDPSTRWFEIVSKSELAGGSHNAFVVSVGHRFTHVRLNIFPDGGVARLRIHGEAIPRFCTGGPELVSLTAAELGARILDSSDTYFSSAHNLLLPSDPTGMADGWETRRRRGPGHDWVVIQLSAIGELRRVEVDTTHFKGNAPASCSIEACRIREPSGAKTVANALWRSVLLETRLAPDARHTFEPELRLGEEASHVRFNIFPDGGVARLRIFGVVGPSERLRQAVRWLDFLPDEQAGDRLLACCGSTRWAETMVRERPFVSPDELYRAATRCWEALDETAWREAFAAHPRIGDNASGDDAHARWSKAEQAGVSGTGRETLDALAADNRAYEEKFGFVFLICATGKGGDEMLAAVRERIHNEPAAELRIAAAEQAKITRLRLEKLLTS